MRHLLLLLSSLLLSLCASAREPQRGYRGFADLSLTPYIDISLYGDPSDSYCYVGMTTSHGYQFNPHLFVGGGFAFEVDTKHSQLIMPVFAHVRGDFRIRRFTPFAEARLGANLADGPGIFFSAHARNITTTSRNPEVALCPYSPAITTPPMYSPPYASGWISELFFWRG